MDKLDKAVIVLAGMCVIFCAIMVSVAYYNENAPIEDVRIIPVNKTTDQHSWIFRGYSELTYNGVKYEGPVYWDGIPGDSIKIYKQGFKTKYNWR